MCSKVISNISCDSGEIVSGATGAEFALLLPHSRQLRKSLNKCVLLLLPGEPKPRMRGGVTSDIKYICCACVVA